MSSERVCICVHVNSVSQLPLVCQVAVQCTHLLLVLTTFLAICLSTNGVMSDKSLDCDGLEARLYNIGDVFMHEWVKWQASAPFSWLGWQKTLHGVKWWCMCCPSIIAFPLQDLMWYENWSCTFTVTCCVQVFPPKNVKKKKNGVRCFCKLFREICFCWCGRMFLCEIQITTQAAFS